MDNGLHTIVFSKPKSYLAEPGKTYFFHVRPKNKHGSVELMGGQTIAATLDESTNCIQFVVAKCSKKDHFCKRIGRAISEGRLRAGKDVLDFMSPDIRNFAQLVFQTYE